MRLLKLSTDQDFIQDIVRLSQGPTPFGHGGAQIVRDNTPKFNQSPGNSWSWSFNSFILVVSPHWCWMVLVLLVPKCSKTNSVESPGVETDDHPVIQPCESWRSSPARRRYRSSDPGTPQNGGPVQRNRKWLEKKQKNHRKATEKPWKTMTRASRTGNTSQKPVKPLVFPFGAPSRSSAGNMSLCSIWSIRIFLCTIGSCQTYFFPGH